MGARLLHGDDTLRPIQVRYFYRGNDHPFTLNELKDFYFKLRENWLIQSDAWPHDRSLRGTSEKTLAVGAVRRHRGTGGKGLGGRQVRRHLEAARMGRLWQ